ncbi:MAG: hypothetical protein EZS28_040643, partial [Streblomastix strix]
RFAPIPSCFSQELAQMINSIIVVDPGKRPNMQQIMSHPSIQRHIHTLPGYKQAVDAAHQAAQNAGMNGKIIYTTFLVQKLIESEKQDSDSDKDRIIINDMNIGTSPYMCCDTCNEDDARCCQMHKLLVGKSFWNESRFTQLE